jgi:hypothetical protein
MGLLYQKKESAHRGENGAQGAPGETSLAGPGPGAQGAPGETSLAGPEKEDNNGIHY